MCSGFNIGIKLQMMWNVVDLNVTAMLKHNLNLEHLEVARSVTKYVM